ncbi:hypothetical protein Q7P37_000408 [Cladosporium fusiforme]
MPKEFTCTACTSTLTGPHLEIESSPLCHPCFQHLFTLALHSESSYPANWGGQKLSAPRYAYILGPTLLHAYLAKETEYACPARERVFCARTDPPRRPDECGNFVGRWQEAKVCVRCEACMWYTCLRCEESFSTSDAVPGREISIAHECDPSRDREVEERAFKGLVRGREWQMCPSERCKRRVELKEGCNHVVCVCGAHFCFVCGAFVRDGKGHWKAEGGCPRFGKKGDERAIYDEGDLWNDNGEVGDEERARRMQEEEDDEEVEALRRAFQLQLRMVEEARRDLVRREAERAGASRDGEGGRRRRRRRMRPRDGNGQVDEGLIRREDLVNQQQQAAPDDSAEPHRRRGFRAFLHDAIDATEHVLFGGPAPRRHRGAERR